MRSLGESRLAGVMVLLLVLTSTVSAAEPTAGEAQLRTPLPPVLMGIVRLEGTDATAELPANSTIELKASRASVQVHRVRMTIVESPAGDFATKPEYVNETYTKDNVSIRFHPASEGRAYMHASGPLVVVMNTSGWRPDVDLTPEAYQYKMNASLPFFFADSPPAGAFSVASGPHVVTIASVREALLFFAEGDLEVAGSAGTYQEHLGTDQERGVPGALGSAPYRIDSYSFVTIRASQIVDEVAIASSRVATTVIDVDGSIAFDDAQGSIAVGRTHYPVTGTRVEMMGQARIEPPASMRDGTWGIQGSFSSIRVWDGRNVIDTTVRDAGIATFVALAVLALTRIGREILGSALATLYTRIKPSKVLDSSERAQLYAIVGTHPGEHLRELQRRVGWGWGTLHYHLGVLKKSGLIVIERSGKHKTVYQRSDADRAPLAQFARAGAALAVLEALRAAPRTQGELQLELGLSRQLVAHHLNVLLRERHVELVPGRPKRYARRVRNAVEATAAAAAQS